MGKVLTKPIASLGSPAGLIGRHAAGPRPQVLIQEVWERTRRFALPTPSKVMLMVLFQHQLGDSLAYFIAVTQKISHNFK